MLYERSENCERPAPGIQRGLMGNPIHPACQSGNNRDARPGQVSRDPGGHLPPIRRHTARADNGDCGAVGFEEFASIVYDRRRRRDLCQQRRIGHVDRRGYRHTTGANILVDRRDIQLLSRAEKFLQGALLQASPELRNWRAPCRSQAAKRLHQASQSRRTDVGNAMERDPVGALRESIVAGCRRDGIGTG